MLKSFSVYYYSILVDVINEFFEVKIVYYHTGTF